MSLPHAGALSSITHAPLSSHTFHHSSALFTLVLSRMAGAYSPAHAPVYLTNFSNASASSTTSVLRVVVCCSTSGGLDQRLMVELVK